MKVRCGLAIALALSACEHPPKCIAQFPASITADTELTADCSPYRVNGYSEIDALLTLDQGVHIELTSGASLVVNATGTLNARGQAGAPVVFEPAPGADAWDQIAIDGETANADLQYVQFVDGGATRSTLLVAGLDRSALQISSGAGVRLQHVRILNSNSVGSRVTSGLVAGSTDLSIIDAVAAPVSMGADVLGSLPTLQIQQASQRAIEVKGGPNSVTGVTTWASQPVPLEIVGDLNVVTTASRSQLTIAAPNSLVFDPGATFHVGADAGLTVNGAVSLDAVDASAGWGGLVFERGSAASELSGGSIAHGCGGSYSNPSTCALVQIDATHGYPNIHDESFSAPSPSLAGHTVCLAITSPSAAPPPSGFPPGATFSACGDADVIWNPQ